MDGVFVAFHNTARIFGFQYISLEEMDERLFGGPGRGNPVFEKCMGLLEAVADEVIHTFPEQVRLVPSHVSFEPNHRRSLSGAHLKRTKEKT